MADEYAELAADLEPLESDLLRAAENADSTGATMLARLLETWAHSLAMARSDLAGTERPGTLPNYLRSVEDYEPPYLDTDDDGRLMFDGGREFSAQPQVCPECGLTLDSNGECKTGGCPGPDADE